MNNEFAINQVYNWFAIQITFRSTKWHLRKDASLSITWPQSQYLQLSGVPLYNSFLPGWKFRPFIFFCSANILKVLRAYENFNPAMNICQREQRNNLQTTYVRFSEVQADLDYPLPPLLPFLNKKTLAYMRVYTVMEKLNVANCIFLSDYYFLCFYCWSELERIVTIKLNVKNWESVVNTRV